MDDRDGREALEVVHGEQRGPLDQAMDEQAVRARVDGRDAPEVDLVEEGIGRQRAVEIGQGREADDRVGGEADDGILGRSALAVGGGGRTRGPHPHGHVR